MIQEYKMNEDLVGIKKLIENLEKEIENLNYRNEQAVNRNGQLLKAYFSLKEEYLTALKKLEYYEHIFELRKDSIHDTINNVKGTMNKRR